MSTDRAGTEIFMKTPARGWRRGDSTSLKLGRHASGVKQ
jgi:hypothetical protein